MQFLICTFHFFLNYAQVCGFSDQITWCRTGGEGTRINRKQVIEAVDAQLKRLGTDYIDLLQFHWPDRYVVSFK